MKCLLPKENYPGALIVRCQSVYSSSLLSMSSQTMQIREKSCFHVFQKFKFAVTSTKYMIHMYYYHILNCTTNKRYKTLSVSNAFQNNSFSRIHIHDIIDWFLVFNSLFHFTNSIRVKFQIIKCLLCWMTLVSDVHCLVVEIEGNYMWNQRGNTLSGN